MIPIGIETSRNHAANCRQITFWLFIVLLSAQLDYFHSNDIHDFQ